MLDQSRETIQPAPNTRNRQQAHIHIRLAQQQDHHPPNAKHAPDILRVGDDRKRETLVPRDWLAKSDSIVDTIFPQGVVNSHVQGLSSAKHGQAHDRLQGGDALGLEGWEILRGRRGGREAMS